MAALLKSATTSYIDPIMLQHKLAVLFALMALPAGLAAQSDTASTAQNSEIRQEREAEILANIQERETIVSSSAYQEAVIEPLARFEVAHHRALGGPLVQCQIDAIARRINGTFPEGNGSSSSSSAGNVNKDAACEKKSDRRKIRRQKERNQLLYDALASIGGYYNNGTDQEKTVLIVVGNSLLYSPFGRLVGQAIGAFHKQIEPKVIQTNIENQSTVAIAAALSLFSERDVSFVLQEIEAGDNTHQSHNAATGVKVFLSISARNRKR